MKGNECMLVGITMLVLVHNIIENDVHYTSRAPPYTRFPYISN